MFRYDYSPAALLSALAAQLIALIAGVALMTAPVAAADALALEPFTAQADVGDLSPSGTAAFDAESQTFTLTAAGVNMWERRDECRFVWKPITGDAQIACEVALAPARPESNVHRKLGVMFRQSLEPDSPYVDVAVHGDGLVSLQFRKTPGGVTEQIPAAIVGADMIQLERQGSVFTMRVAHRGDPFSTPRTVEVDLGPEALVGIYLCSHDAGVVETGMFRNVRITVPAWEGLVQYRDYLGSNLEILDVDTGRREIVYRVDDSLQAPNWTRDGRALIFNRNGKLSRFDLAARTVVEIDTGFATANNNDHVLSTDGSQLAISHHAADDDGQSNIYVLPTAGGEPRRVTPLGPSYLHGWSPDDKTLVFTGVRGEECDIFTIPVAGGEATRLTSAPGVDDGPEYAPDGRRIYFNSSRTGRMQIWRMYPDGGDQEQVTDGPFQNWFPHISPDGRRIAFLSFPASVAADLHPFYEPVYLQLMPYPGGPSRIIAYLYGGQGTINVPSWSPDGKRLAFVSNSK